MHLDVLLAATIPIAIVVLVMLAVQPQLLKAIAGAIVFALTDPWNAAILAFKKTYDAGLALMMMLASALAISTKYNPMLAGAGGRLTTRSTYGKTKDQGGGLSLMSRAPLLTGLFGMFHSTTSSRAPDAGVTSGRVTEHIFLDGDCRGTNTDNDYKSVRRSGSA